MLHQDQVEQGRKLLAYLDTNTSRPSQRGNGYTRRKQLMANITNSPWAKLMASVAL
jgi:hypothetical protein